MRTALEIPNECRRSAGEHATQPSDPNQGLLNRRIGVATATRKASVSLAEHDGDEVVNVSARLKDVVSSAAQLHGSNQAAGVNVNIAHVRVPTEAERAERRARHAKLDAITAKLRQLESDQTSTGYIPLGRGRA